MTLRQQFLAVLRELPGFVLGAPDRWLLRVHAPEDFGDGKAYCSHHRPIQEWPCREFADAADRVDARKGVGA